MGDEDPRPSPPPSPQWARLVLVDEGGATREVEELGDEAMPYAAARIRPIDNCTPIVPTFVLDIDKSCGMGSYCGPAMRIVRVTNGRIEFVQDQHGVFVSAMSGLKGQYHIDSIGKDRRCALNIKYSRLGPAPKFASGPRIPESDFFTGQIQVLETRTRENASSWVYTERVSLGLWEAD